MLIEDNAVVLFQGDSITDASRNRDEASHMGNGYANMVAAWFSALHPAKNVKFINRGISGNRAKDLRNRWKQDCLDLKPSWVSVLIGINDTWRRFDQNSPTTTQEYEEHYRTILRDTVNTLGAKLIIMEPFWLPTTVTFDPVEWRKDLDPKIAVARKVAREFNAVYVPLDGVFAAAAAQRYMVFWLPDGVHPSQAGHALIAQAWLKAVGAI